MKMAKPNEDDVRAAEMLFRLLADIAHGYYPHDDDADADKEPRYLDEDNWDHLRRVYDLLKQTLDIAPNWPGKVIGGMLWVIMNPDNQLLDGTKNVIELHPDLLKGLAIVQEQRATMLDRMESEARDSVAYLVEDLAYHQQREMALSAAARTRAFFAKLDHAYH